MTKNMDWINLYRQALKEPDAQKRLARAEEAEAAMKQVLRVAVEEGDSDQRHAVSEALHHLSILRDST
jgi:hypothetical protein